MEGNQDATRQSDSLLCGPHRPLFIPEAPEGKHMLLVQVDPGQSPESESLPLYMEGREGLGKRQATPVWHLTVFFKGSLRRSYILGSCKMKWAVSALPTGARELSYGVKRGEQSRDQCRNAASCGNYISLFQDPAHSRRQERSAFLCQSGRQLQSKSLRGVGSRPPLFWPGSARGPHSGHAVEQSLLHACRGSSCP